MGNYSKRNNMQVNNKAAKNYRHLHNQKKNFETLNILTENRHISNLNVNHYLEELEFAAQTSYTMNDKRNLATSHDF